MGGCRPGSLSVGHCRSHLGRVHHPEAEFCPICASDFWGLLQRHWFQAGAAGYSRLSRIPCYLVSSLPQLDFVLRVSLAARSTPYPSVNVPPSASMFPPPPVPSQASSPSFCPPCLPDYRPTSGGTGLFSLHICVPSPSPPSVLLSVFKCRTPKRKKKGKKAQDHPSFAPN